MTLSVSGSLRASLIRSLRAKFNGVKAAGQGAGPVLGPEMITNGDFSGGATGWTPGTGWTIASGLGTKAAGSTADLLNTAALPTAGLKYRVTYTLAFTAGTFMARIGNTPGVTRSASGTYTEDIIATNTIAFSIRGSSTGVGSVSNISMKRVL